ncbi:MAG: hypothetical protein DME38_01320 [Verrucomicrobia bacterium]|nr:MAG: hypothetical protein DME38_01320 [Verrucomicrobiota bacterium]
MEEQNDKEIASKRQRDQMFRLVTKGFYNELMNYGVGKAEVIRVASHLLDNLLAKEKRPAEEQPYYNGIFTLASVKDEWASRKRLIIEPVRLRPLEMPIVKKVAGWLKDRTVRESFVPAFPETERELKEYFSDPTREYFSIDYSDETVGIVGGENIDIHSRDINMSNINLNSGFGFELEGVFLDEIMIGGKHQDVVRMALFKPLWLQIFSPKS